jgi:hypothetical protein
VEDLLRLRASFLALFFPVLTALLFLRILGLTFLFGSSSQAVVHMAWSFRNDLLLDLLLEQLLEPSPSRWLRLLLNKVLVDVVEVEVEASFGLKDDTRSLFTPLSN